MATYDQLYPFVSPWVPECPDFTMTHAIRQATIAFCEKTGVWRTALNTVMSNGGILTFNAVLSAASSGTLSSAFAGTSNNYTLEFGDGTNRAVYLTNGSTAVTWTGPVTSGVSVPYWQTTYDIPFPSSNSALVRILRFVLSSIKGVVVTTDFGNDMLLNNRNADAVWTEDKLTFGVNPAPIDTNTRYDLTVSLKPTQASGSFPNILLEQYATHISNGAIAELLAMPKQPWTHLTNAAVRQTMFDDACNSVAMQLAKGYGRTRGRSKAHFY
jgi:hypothetical protein